MIKGIGPGMAERMVAHFGTGSVAIIEQEPGRLTEVPCGVQELGHGP
jgi:exodeoxyribonuclease V alpha subunit